MAEIFYSSTLQYEEVSALMHYALRNFMGNGLKGGNANSMCWMIF